MAERGEDSSPILGEYIPEEHASPILGEHLPSPRLQQPWLDTSNDDIWIDNPPLSQAHSTLPEVPAPAAPPALATRQRIAFQELFDPPLPSNASDVSVYWDPLPHENLPPNWENVVTLTQELAERYLSMQELIIQLTEFNDLEDMYDYDEFLEPPAAIPTTFTNRPVDYVGNPRPPRMADVEAAIRSLADSRSIPGAPRTRAAGEARAMLHYLKSCSYIAVRLMRGLCTTLGSTMSYTQVPDQHLPGFIMRWFTDIVSLHKPNIPIDRCEANWMARYLLERDWNSLANETRRRYSRPQAPHAYGTRNNPRVVIPETQSRPPNR